MKWLAIIYLFAVTIGLCSHIEKLEQSDKIKTAQIESLTNAVAGINLELHNHVRQ